MIRLFKHYVPRAVLLLCLLEMLLLITAGEAGWVIRNWQIGNKVTPIGERVPELLSFAFAVQVAMLAVGGYRGEALRSFRFAVARLIVAMALALPIVAFLFFMLPELTLWRSNTVYAMAIGFVLVALARLMLGRFFDAETFKRRVLVLGAGARANRITVLSRHPDARFIVVAHVAMGDCEQKVDDALDRAAIESLSDIVHERRVDEVVLALQERRNAMPVDDLLKVRTTGVHVTEISTFLERETGRVDLRSVNPSWFILSDGFSSGRRVSALLKRGFDIFVSAVLIVLTAPLVLLGAVLVRLDSPGPAFFRQERMGLFGEPFTIVKLRSMRTDAEAAGKAVWAERNDPRVTRIGRLIRKIRIDELPQLWMVLKGDMSFVGPRPERPQFVAELARSMPYYAERHVVKPGITGWAQINFPYGASLDDARHKLEYDLYYAKNYTPFLDLLILLQTVRVLLWSDGAR